MTRSARCAIRRPRLTLPTKSNVRVSPNTIKVKSAIRPGRSILTYDGWRRIAQSLRISNRELQIIQGVFDDQKEFAIAGELMISVHTVHTHLERLYRKLGVSSRVALVLCILSEYLSSLANLF